MAGGMKALIVDDELSAQRRLGRLLSMHPGVEIVGEAQDGVEALDLIEARKPEVVFLDIQMPELDGFGVVRALPSSAETPLIVFATSYDQHALAAFEANAVAYLLKPIEEERLAIVMERLKRLLASADDRMLEKERLSAVTTETARLHRLVCRKGNRVMLFDPAEILWFYIDGGIVRARTATDTYWVNYQLHQLETGLNSEVFFRARRDILVNLDGVKGIKPFDRSTFVLVMNDSQGTEVQVSERQAKELRQRLPGL